MLEKRRGFRKKLGVSGREKRGGIPSGLFLLFSSTSLLAFFCSNQVPFSRALCILTSFSSSSSFSSHKNLEKNENISKEVELGVTELPLNGLIIRMLGNKAEQLFDLNKKFAVLLESFIKQKPIHLIDTEYAV